MMITVDGVNGRLGINPGSALPLSIVSVLWLDLAMRIKMTGTSRDRYKALVLKITRRTRKKYGPDEKSRIIFVGLRGEISVADLCRSTRHVFLK